MANAKDSIEISYYGDGRMSYAEYRGKIYTIPRVVPEEEKIGARNKFWMKHPDNDKRFLVKYAIEMEDLGEVLFYEFCRQGNLDIDVVPYQMAEVKGKDGMETACVCPSYIRENTAEEEHSAERIYGKYNKQAKIYSANPEREPNLDFTIHQYRKMLEDKYPGYQGIEEALTHITKMTILDYFTLQEDRHFGNFSFFVSPEDAKEKKITAVPVYDSGNIWGLSHPRDGNIIHETKDALRNVPLLGIMTPTAAIKQANTGKMRVATPPKDEQTMLTFEQELAEVIVLDDELAAFYNQVRGVNLSKVLDSVGDMLDERTKKSIMTFMNARKGRLDKSIEAAKAALGMPDTTTDRGVEK